MKVGFSGAPLEQAQRLPDLESPTGDQAQPLCKTAQKQAQKTSRESFRVQLSPTPGTQGRMVTQRSGMGLTHIDVQAGLSEGTVTTVSSDTLFVWL